jgi:Arc/MetJ-type ribon-helix-helix transcriptional regulator
MNMIGDGIVPEIPDDPPESKDISANTFLLPKRFLIHLTPLKYMMDAVRSEGRVIGSKVSAVELEEIKKQVASGAYLNTSDFLRDAIRDKLAAIKTIKYRDVDYETAKKEVMGYFQDRGEAYPSDLEEDLELDYDLIRQIIDELKREGRLAVL